MSVYSNPASRSTEQAAVYIAAVLDLLGQDDPRTVLRGMIGALEKAAGGLTPDQITRPERPGKWSMRHVLQHLADSELVWAYRLRMVLAHDRPALTGYDQDLWAERLHYDRADAAQALRDFSALRQANLRILDAASGDDLRRVGVHSERGDESLEHMIRLYAGHDVLHLRQLERIRRAVSSPA